MYEIKFNHYYPKLYEQTSAELISVRELSFPEDIQAPLVSYDTSFYDELGRFCFFPLEIGNYIQLIFLGNYHIPFCTLRKDDEEGKLDFYRECIGKKFKIVYEKGE